MKPDLKSPSKFLRAGIARGLAREEDEVSIDEGGGDSGAGIIRGMAVLTVGEALGHGLWIDGVMLEQVRDAMNAGRGAKARFTHPDMSGDGLGKFTGRVKGGDIDGDVLRGDLHFSPSAHDTPDGDLAGYLMRLASDDPEAFGNSIAFESDPDAEARFMLEHGAKLEGDYLDRSEFKSPDPRNTKNMRHARMKQLLAVDAVDDPAANPSGLFRRGDDVVADAEKLLAFGLGLSTERPTLTAFDCNPDRAAGFVQRFLARNKLTLFREGKPMTTAELDADLAKQFSTTITPATAKKLAAAKEDRDADREAAGEEIADADKDEGEDKGTKQQGGDFAAKEGCEEMDDEEDEDTTGLAKDGKPKVLAKGGEATGGSSAGDQGKSQEDYQEVQEEVHEGAAADAKEGTPVESPSKKKEKGVGPMGDASTNVGYKAAVAECQKFTAAFGPQGAVWFSEGKSFAEAQQLHTAALAKENADLKKQNAELAAKAAKGRGLSKPVHAGGEASSVSPEQNQLAQAVGGGGIARFAVGIAEQMATIKNRRN